jgi:hypothetical protein
MMCTEATAKRGMEILNEREAGIVIDVYRHGILACFTHDRIVGDMGMERRRKDKPELHVMSWDVARWWNLADAV